MVGGDDLQSTDGAVSDVVGERQLVDADGVVAGHVPELRRQGDVELGCIIAETDVEPYIAVRVVQLESHGLAIPLGDITLSERNVRAYIIRQSEARE